MCVTRHKHFGALCKLLTTSWISSFFAPTQAVQSAGSSVVRYELKHFIKFLIIRQILRSAFQKYVFWWRVNFVGILGYLQPDKTVLHMWCSKRKAYSEVSDYVYDKSYRISCRTSTTRFTCWKNSKATFVTYVCSTLGIYRVRASK